MSIVAQNSEFSRLIEQLAQAIRGEVGQRRDWALVGIRSRGDDLAQRLAAQLEPAHVGTLDITLYRDDLSEIGAQPVVRTTEIDFNIEGIDVVLVDDVLMTGRSIRAALQSLMDLGRPRRVWLAVLVDRGGRELPIAPDFVGMDLSEGEAVGPGQRVDVCIRPTDEQDAILIRPLEEGQPT